MLANAEVHPTLPVVELERAKKFYTEKLGLKVVREDPSPGAVLAAGKGTGVYLYQRSATKADHTVAGFEVEDFDAVFNDLKSKGITFENYDMPNLKTQDGVMTMQTPDGVMKGAWFKDTEGNILAIANRL